MYGCGETVYVRTPTYPPNLATKNLFREKDYKRRQGGGGEKSQYSGIFIMSSGSRLSALGSRLSALGSRFSVLVPTVGCWRLTCRHVHQAKYHSRQERLRVCGPNGRSQGKNCSVGGLGHNLGPPRIMKGADLSDNRNNAAVLKPMYNMKETTNMLIYRDVFIECL